jgi:cytochrome c
MGKIGFMILAVLFAVTANAAAEQGEDIFKAMRCGTCHRTETGTTPSLKDIAGAYQGKGGRLIGYLKGEGPAIINPEKAGSMKRYIEKTKALSDEERKALADFIMVHGK